MNKTINIDVPEGFEIDTEKSNLAEGKIVFKKKEATPWKQSNPKINGYYLDTDNKLRELAISTPWAEHNKNVFAKAKQALSMRAMAQLSQIIQNDKRFGGPIADEEWEDNSTKYTIDRYDNTIVKETWTTYYRFLAFHTPEERDLFFEENMDLIKQYYMLN